MAWVEDLRENNFTICVTQAGRNEKKNVKTFAMVDWLAYQGAPDGGVSGEMACRHGGLERTAVQFPFLRLVGHTLQ